MSKPINTFRDLIAWQKAMAFVTEIYRITRTLPKEETYGMTSQMRRAAVSIPSNLAEGHAHRSRTEYGRFVQISIGSLHELDTQLEIAVNLGYLTPSSYAELQEKVRELERMLTSLHQKLIRPPDFPKAQ